MQIRLFLFLWLVVPIAYSKCVTPLWLINLVKNKSVLFNKINDLNKKYKVNLFSELGINVDNIPDKESMGRNAVKLLMAHESDWTLSEKLEMWDAAIVVINNVDPPFLERQMKSPDGRYIMKQSPHEDFIDGLHPTILFGEDAVVFRWYPEVPYLDEAAVESFVEGAN